MRRKVPFARKPRRELLPACGNAIKLCHFPRCTQRKFFAQQNKSQRHLEDRESIAIEKRPQRGPFHLNFCRARFHMSRFMT